MRICSKTRLDRILSGIGSVLGLALLFYSIVHIRQPVYIIIGVLSLISCLSYFVYSYASQNKSGGVNLGKTAEWFDVAYLALFSSSIAVYLFRPDVYSRPLSYILLVCGMALVVFVKVVSCRSLQMVITIAEVVLIGLSLEWSVTLMFPTVVGIDPWFHLTQTMRVLNGEILGLASSPAMYYIVGGTMKVTGLSYNLATMVSVSLMQVVLDTLLVVGIARLIGLNIRVGFVAALLMVTANWHIFFGFWTIPNTLGATLVLVMTWCILRWHRGHGKLWLIAGSLVFGILLFTHIFAVIWAIVVVLCFSIWVFVSGRLRFTLYPLANICVCVLGVVVFVWQAGYMNTLTTFIRNGFNPGRVGLTEAPLISSAVSSTPMYMETLSSAPLWETLFNSMGMFLFFALAFWGCFIMVKKKKGLWWMATGMVVLGVGFFPMLFGMSVIEHRWWYFAELIFSIPLGLFILWLARRKVMIAASFVFCLMFLMVMGLPSNIDNRAVSANQIVRYGMTNDEIEGMRIALSYGGQVGVDGYFTLAMYVFPKESERIKDITPYLLNGDFGGLNCDVVLLRSEVRFAPISSGNASIYRLRYDPVKLLSPKYVCVYENNDVLVMVKS